MLGTRCKCRDDLEISSEYEFGISCFDTCEFCIGDYTFSYGKDCMEFDKDSFDGIKLCVEAEEDGYDTNVDVSIDGESCSQATLEYLGVIQVDCSNLGYSSNIVLNDLTSSEDEGPFAFYDESNDVENITAKDGCDPTSASSMINTMLSFSLP